MEIGFSTDESRHFNSGQAERFGTFLWKQRVNIRGRRLSVAGSEVSGNRRFS